MDLINIVSEKDQNKTAEHNIVAIKRSFGRCYYEFKEDYVHIFDLYVFPEFRRQGKARKLLQLAINAIREKGYSGQIQIVAQPRENSISVNKLISFYKSLNLDVYTYYG